MIKANEKYWARKIFNVYINNLLKKNFSRFNSVNKIELPKSNESIVITPNHFSWWDGFFIDFILRKESGYKIKLMMLQEQLTRYWFFKYVGAFSINLENKLSIKKTIEYSQELLNEKNNCLVIYPQGQIEPFDKRPVQFKEGLKLIIRNIPETKVIPAAFKIEFSNNKKPFVAFRLGKIVNSKQVHDDFDNYKFLFNNNLNCLNAAVTEAKFYKNYFLNDY